MKKEIDGIIYESKPSIDVFDPVSKRYVQYCRGCAGKFDILLCDKLQNCLETKIIWKKTGVLNEKRN